MSEIDKIKNEYQLSTLEDFKTQTDHRLVELLMRLQALENISNASQEQLAEMKVHKENLKLLGDLKRHVERQHDENRFISKHFDELKHLGDEWVKLFKKMNSDRMDEILALKTRIGVLEKMLVEPRAQALVDAVGSAYKPIAHDCPHCKRPMK